MPSSTDIGMLWKLDWHNIKWTQPGGKGTKVFPAQASNSPFTAYPVPGQVIDEVGQSLWRAGCGHGFDVFLLQRDYDAVTKQSCMVVACPICSYIINLIEPADAAFDPMSHPVIVG